MEILGMRKESFSRIKKVLAETGFVDYPRSPSKDNPIYIKMGEGKKIEVNQIDNNKGTKVNEIDNNKDTEVNEIDNRSYPNCQLKLTKTVTSLYIDETRSKIKMYSKNNRLL